MHSRIKFAAAAAVVGLAVGIPSANAAVDHFITGKDVKNGSLHRSDLDKKVRKALKHRGKDGAPGAIGAQGPRGLTGPQGAKGLKGDKGQKGDSYLAGAYYSVAYYDVGNTNAGAIATVACKDTADTAISGGVSVDDPTKNTPVSQSFPGRMDWSTNTPRPDRLDGWIIQFGGNAGQTSDKSPDKVKVWALCAPGLNIPVEQTYTQTG